MTYWAVNTVFTCRPTFYESLTSDKHDCMAACLKNRQTCRKSHHLYITCSKCPPPARTKILDVYELKRRIRTSEQIWITLFIERAVGEWRPRAITYTQTFRAYHVQIMFDNFPDNNCKSLLNDSFKCTSNQCGSICHFKFPKVVLAHISRKVGALYTILLSVNSRTCLSIFIIIGSYLTDKSKR